MNQDKSENDPSFAIEFKRKKNVDTIVQHGRYDHNHSRQKRRKIELYEDERMGRNNVSLLITTKQSM